MKWLESALDTGLKEREFWEMTIPEIQRHIDSYLRVKKRNDQERASYDYILADAIGRSVARLYSKSANMPDISELYPTLFEAEEIMAHKQQQMAELSALRFKQFAASHNKKFKEVAK